MARSHKAGGQLVRRLNHNTNYNNFSGTFTFSSLAAYIAGQPETFTQYVGNPFLDDTQIELGTFLQSDWKAAKNLNLSLGARYETQTNISANNLDPRLGFAYQFSKNTVVRGGSARSISEWCSLSSINFCVSTVYTRSNSMC